MLDKGRASMASAYKSRLLSEAPKRNIIIGSPKNTYEFLKTCRVRAFQMELGFESVGFVQRGKLEYPDNNFSQNGRELTTNSSHIGPVDDGIFTRATLVGGECSHHCTTLAPLALSCSFTTLNNAGITHKHKLLLLSIQSAAFVNTVSNIVSCFWKKW